MASGTRPQGRYLLIGHELQMLRESRGLTLNAASRHSHHSSSWLSMAENGFVQIRTDDLKAVLDNYDCEPGLREGLHFLAERGRFGGWWREYQGVLPAAMIDYASLESDALSIFDFQVNAVPGQLQIEEYARAVTQMSSAHLSDKAEAMTEFRMRRQQFWDGPIPAGLQTVICEGGLRLLVGGRRVAGAQLVRLRELAERPNIDLRILPAESGAHAAMGSSFSVLRFKPRGALSMILRSGNIQPPPLMDAESRTVYAGVAGLLLDQSLSPNDSLELLDRIASEL